MASGPKKGQRKPNMDEIEQAKVRTGRHFLCLCYVVITSIYSQRQEAICMIIEICDIEA